MTTRDSASSGQVIIILPVRASCDTYTRRYDLNGSTCPLASSIWCTQPPTDPEGPHGYDELGNSVNSEVIIVNLYKLLVLLYPNNVLVYQIINTCYYA
jgi:hypothetical protein